MIEPLLLWNRFSLHRDVEGFKAWDVAGGFASHNRRLARPTMSCLLIASRWQLIHIYSWTLLLPYVSDSCPSRRTLVSGATVLPLVVPVLLLLRVAVGVGRRGVEALIQIRIELMVSLKSTLRIRSLKKLLSGMSAWLWWSLEHTSDII